MWTHGNSSPHRHTDRRVTPAEATPWREETPTGRHGRESGRRAEHESGSARHPGRSSLLSDAVTTRELTHPKKLPAGTAKSARSREIRTVDHGHLPTRSSPYRRFRRS